MNRENKVAIPRWHYRDVQKDAASILETAAGGAGLKGAMVAFLAGRAGGLPEGTTPESAADAILKAVDGFAAAKATVRTADDVRNALRAAVAEMSTDQALRYLAMLDCTFGVCDAQMNGDGKIPSAEEVRNRILTAAAGGGETDVAARIDALAERIAGDSLKAYVFATGVGELQELAAVQASEETGMSQAMAERIHAALSAGVGKGDVYAATACACYGRILDGKIPGVPKENMDAGVLTALVVAGMEKASVLVRLARGEIDAELAKDLLAAIWRTLKVVLIGLIQMAVAVAVAGFAIWAIPTFLLWLMTAAYVLPVIGLVIGVIAAIECHEDVKGAIDWLGETVGTLGRLVGNGLRWVWDAVTGEAAAETEAVPAAC